MYFKVIVKHQDLISIEENYKAFKPLKLLSYRIQSSIEVKVINWNKIDQWLHKVFNLGSSLRVCSNPYNMNLSLLEQISVNQRDVAYSEISVLTPLVQRIFCRGTSPSAICCDDLRSASCCDGTLSSANGFDDT